MANTSPCQSAKINGPLEPLEGKWKNEYMGSQPFDFRRDGTKLWGTFDFEDCTGILLVDPAPLKASNAPLLCTWRGREKGEGEIQWMESECKGEMVFLGGGKIMGFLDPYDVEFTVTLDVKTKEPVRTVEDNRKEWKGTTRKLTQERGAAVGVNATMTTTTTTMTTTTMKTMRETLARMNLA